MIHRRILASVSVLCLLPLGGLPRPATAGPSPIEVEFDYSPSDVEWSVSPQGGVRLALRGVPRRSPRFVAAPEGLAFLAIPDGQAPVSVRVEGLDPVSLAGQAQGIEPSRMLTWPPPDAVGEGAGDYWMRGTRLLAVRFRPVVWDEEKDELVLWSRIRIRVEAADAGLPEGVWRPERAYTRAEAEFKELLRQLVANPEQVLKPAAAGGKPGARPGPASVSADPYSPLFRPSVDGSPVDYVIITGQSLAPEFDRLVEWRMKTGTVTAVRTVEWIVDQYREGVDTPDRIRRFIRDAASRWGTQWFLLAGDFDIIPMRMGKTRYYGGEDIPTELYYQCLDRTWNENGNDLFGEGSAPDVGNLPADDVDLFPDVWISRIPCSTPEGVRAVIDKTFRYERTPPVHPDYIPTFLTLAEMLQPSNWQKGDTVVFDGAFLAEQAIDQLPASFRVSRLYENWCDPRWSATAIPLRKPTAIDSINAGFEIVHHVGHGYRNNLSVGEGGLEIISDDADNFTNATEPFLFFGINCNSASIDFDSISEHFMCNPNGGCFTYLGSTRFDFPGSDDPYQNEFYRGLFLRRPIAQAHAMAKIASIPNAQRDNPDRWHQMSLVCFAEPLVTIRSETPRPLTVSHPSAMELGGSVPVTVTLQGAPVEGARVTLYRAGDIFTTGTTAADGTIVLPGPADQAGPVSITATAYNAIPYEGQILAGAAGAAYLEVLGLRIDDSPAGNGDGRLDAGETADLHFNVRNTGGQTASGIALTFSETAGGLTVLNPVTDLMDLAPGESDSTFETQIIRVAAAPDIATALDVHGELLLQWTGGSRVDPVGLRVGGIGLWIESQTVSSQAVPESVELRLKLLNRGVAAARDVRLRLETQDPRITLTNAQVDLGSIPGDGAAETAAPLSFHYAEFEAIAAVDLVMEANGTELARNPVDVTPPDAPPDPHGRSGPSSIVLGWNPAPGPQSDLRGYAVFRALSEAGPFQQINEVTDNPMGYYEDQGLDPFTRYYYRVAAQDRSGNLSPPTGTVSFSTSLPTLSNWPLDRVLGTPASPVIHDLNGDGLLEVIAAGEEIYVVHADGTEFVDGDRDSRTLGIFSQTSRATFWGTPAVADVDGDGILDIVAAGWASGRLYVFGVDGTIRAGWPKNLFLPAESPDGLQPWASPLVADVDGNQDLEIFIPAGRFLYAFHHDGTEVIDGDQDPATTGPFLNLIEGFNYATPAAADFDNDGLAEIVVGTRRGILYLLKGDGTVVFSRDFRAGGQATAAITGSPAIADLDLDGELEMIVPVRNLLEVHALNRFGESPPGWPVRIAINQDLDPSPTVADLNGDAYPDVVLAGGSGRIVVVRGQDGGLFPGFPVDLAPAEGGPLGVRGTPCLGDVTGDSVPDILVGTQNASLHGVSVTGQILPGFPLRAGHNIEGGPLLWDVDGNGLTDLLFGSFDRKIYAFSTPGVFSTETCPWPMFRHDQMNSGFIGKPLSVPVAPALRFFNIFSTPSGVELAWRADDPSAGWAGWLVGREEVGGEAGEVRLTESPLAPVEKMRYTDASARPGSTYRYTVIGVGRAGLETRFLPALFEVPEAAPPRTLLRQNAPNPVRDATSILFSLARASPVRLEVFDVSGRRVRSLLDEPREPGTHSVVWDVADEAGEPVPDGVYFYRIAAGGRTLTRKMMVTR